MVIICLGIIWNDLKRNHHHLRSLCLCICVSYIVLVTYLFTVRVYNIIVCLSLHHLHHHHNHSPDTYTCFQYVLGRLITVQFCRFLLPFYVSCGPLVLYHPILVIFFSYLSRQKTMIYLYTTMLRLVATK